VLAQFRFGVSLQISRSTIGQVALAALPLIANSGPSHAGAPFVTDDAETLTTGHYEINLGSNYTHRQGETGGSIIAIDANYGVTERLEAHVYVPLAFDRVSGGKTNIGIGDVELGFKYRLVDSGAWGDWAPAIAVEPTVDFPTGAASHNLGTGNVHAFVPVWLSKQWDKLTVFGGAGYALNPGRGNRNWVFTGLGATYDVNESWTLGGEVFYASAAGTGQPGGVGFNVGGVYNINETYHVLFSAGRNLTNASKTNNVSAFLGLQLTF
jgi:hypothetical protein